MDAKKMPEYEAPQVITYTDEEILEELGPAQASSYGGGKPDPNKVDDIIR
jgi:hypothetical protein